MGGYERLRDGIRREGREEEGIRKGYAMGKQSDEKTHLHERRQLHGATLAQLEPGRDAAQIVAVERERGDFRRRVREEFISPLESLSNQDVRSSAEGVLRALRHRG